MDAVDNDGVTALMQACDGGHEQVCSSNAAGVCTCVITGAFVCFVHTFSSHHLEQVTRALLEAGAAVNSQKNNGFTALMLAAQNGHEQVRFAV